MHKKYTLTRGFTLVELLIVIAIIGILAAIILVAYNGIQNEANVASLQTDTNSGAKTLELFKVQNSSYPTAIDCSTTPAANTVCLQNSPTTVFSYNPSTDLSSFCLQADSSINPGLGSYHYSSKEAGIKTGACPGGWTAIWAGDQNTCGIANSQLYCWGHNNQGQLGTGNTTNVNTPHAISTPMFAASTITKLTMGDFQTCAIASGKAYCWGTDQDGELGDGSGGAQYSPQPVIATAGQQLNGKTVTDINAGFQNTCAVASGNFYCWGSNANGALGDNSGSTQYYPVAVSTTGSLSGKTAQVLGSGTGYYGVCGVASNASYCWGGNYYSNAGNGTTGNINTTPIATLTSGVLSGKTVTALSTSQQETCAIANSAAYCWGDAGFSGNGTATAQTNPVAVDTTGGDLRSSQTVQSIATIGSTTCLIADSQLYCWGTSMPWRKADGSTYATDPHYPYSPLKAIGGLASVHFVSLTASLSHMCGLSDSGYAYCWGASFYGETGNAFGSLVSNSTNAYKMSSP